MHTVLTPQWTSKLCSERTARDARCGLSLSFTSSTSKGSSTAAEPGVLALIASRIASADRDTCTNSLQVEGSDTEPDTVLQLFESFGPGTVGLVACNAELLKCEIRGMW